MSTMYEETEQGHTVEVHTAYNYFAAIDQILSLRKYKVLSNFLTVQHAVCMQIYSIYLPYSYHGFKHQKTYIYNKKIKS